MNAQPKKHWCPYCKVKGHSVHRCPGVSLLEEKFAALSMALTYKQAIEVQEIINKAFGDCAVAEEQIPWAMELVIGIIEDVIIKEKKDVDQIIYLPSYIDMPPMPASRRKHKRNRPKECSQKTKKEPQGPTVSEILDAYYDDPDDQAGAKEVDLEELLKKLTAECDFITQRWSSRKEETPIMGVEANENEASEYYRKASDIENSERTNDLGHCHKGIRIEKNKCNTFINYQKSLDISHVARTFKLE